MAGVNDGRRCLIVNRECTDLSAEGYAALAVLVEMVWAVQTLGHRMAYALDLIGARNCLVQKKKQAFNKAKTDVMGLLRGLEVAFDTTFDYATCRVKGEEAERTELLQRYADDILHLSLLFYSRVDGEDGDKKARVFRAISNFKQIPGFDAEALMSFFKLQ
jgi:hypothetical protein